MANTVPAESKYDSFAEANPATQDIAQAKFNYATMKAELQIESERWKTKRRMAWFSMISMIAATAAMFFLVAQSKMASLDSVISWFYMANTTIIGAYIGSSTWEQVSKLRPTKPSITDASNSASTPFDALNQK